MACVISTTYTIWYRLNIWPLNAYLWPTKQTSFRRHCPVQSSVQQSTQPWRCTGTVVTGRHLAPGDVNIGVREMALHSPGSILGSAVILILLLFLLRIWIKGAKCLSAARLDGKTGIKRRLSPIVIQVGLLICSNVLLCHLYHHLLVTWSNIFGIVWRLRKRCL